MLYESEYEMNVDDDTEQGDQTEHGGLDNVEESGDDSHEGEASDPEEAATESDVEETDDDFDSVAGSDEEDKVPKCVFNPRNKYNPHFEIGMIFSNKVELRDAIHSHAVSTKRSLKIMKNDKRRVYVKCLGDGCQWRAKKKALNAIEGKAEDQFECLWDYAAELRSSNPGSTVQLVMNDGGNGTGQRKFSKFYVCFDALRRGFLSGCRPLIGVDGCHLKGPYGGVLLTAVAIDPNNNLYPLAYAVVAGETRESWQWFLELLKGDLHIVRDDTYTFISDKQKGLIPAFDTGVLTRSKFIASASQVTTQSPLTAGGSQFMLHKFTQCSTTATSQPSGSVVPCLTKGGKKFVTMTNLGAAVAATKKKKKVLKKK
ncbi:UNVERIFIED_CONTAM: hypothetical protein Sradi_3350600 [Sesamum radiatum]|uniref:Transposase MuDR plant domain-containing protein n=1 Tax=Sesamum radiatum TaxID=300843 RepID=A0AAW2R2R6_SESRA